LNRDESKSVFSCHGFRFTVYDSFLSRFTVYGSRLSMVRSTQKEIRQRAPLWLLVLLALNFGLMTWNAKEAETKQPVIKAWAQSAILPVQRATTGVGGAGLGFFRGLWDMRNAPAENDA